MPGTAGTARPRIAPLLRPLGCALLAAGLPGTPRRSPRNPGLSPPDLRRPVQGPAVRRGGNFPCPVRLAAGRAGGARLHSSPPAGSAPPQPSSAWCRTARGGLQPPRGTADRPDPAVDNTDVYAFSSPDSPTRHPRSRTGSRSRSPTAARTSTRSPTDARYNIYSTTTATPRPTSRCGALQDHRQARQLHVPVQQRPGHLASTTRTCCSARRTRWRPSIDGEHWMPRDHRTRRSPRPGSAPPPCPNYQTLRDQAIISASGWQILRRPGRRPVLPRPARVRPALRRRPERGRPGHAGRLQRVTCIALQVPLTDAGAQGRRRSATRSSASG